MIKRSLNILSVLALSVTCSDSSPKGRAKYLAVTFLPLPLTDFPRSGEDGEARKGNKVDLRSKDGEGEDARIENICNRFLLTFL